MHLNVQGIKSKVDQLEIILQQKDIDVCCLSETFFKNSEVDILQLDGFKNIANFCRKLKERGGVAIYAKNTVDCRELNWVAEMSVESHFECCGITICEVNYIIICVYRAPNSNLDIFLVNMEMLLCKLVTRSRNNCKKIFILGDYNVNILEKTNKAELLLNAFRSFNLHPSIAVPTRITSHSQTCIDNIFTNVKNYNVDVLDIGLSDHTCQVISILTSLSYKEKYWYVYNRNPDNYMDIFLKYISQFSFTDVYSATDPNYGYKMFIDTFSLVFDLCVPDKIIKVTHRRNPIWKTKGIATASRHKRQLYLQSLKSNNFVIKNKYKKYCKVMKAVTKQSKRNANINFITQSANKSKATWQIIKQNTTQINVIKNTVDHIIKDGIVIDEPFDIANSMNNYFVNITNSVNVTPYKPLTPPNLTSIFMTPVTTHELIGIVKKLKNKKSTGHDKIPMKAIKLSIEYIAEPLAHIINLTLESGVFPDDLKKALVKPLYKKGPKTEMGNHRPIALLPNFSKIFEKIIYNRILSFFTKNNILNTNQFGFQKGKNTTLAIFKVLRRIWTDIQKKKTAVGLFIDLSKAFDCVSHKILLRQLEHVGIRGAASKLIQSYLTNRQQATILDAYNKATKTITRVQSNYEENLQGVPQGSVLGPLLFLIYVNEFPLVLDHLCVMFADDATIFISEEKLNASNIVDELYNTIKKVMSWLSSINLKVNLDKTKIIQFTNYKQTAQDINLVVGSEKIEQVTSTNFLGITIDNNLNWKSHIEKINKTLSKTCYAISILSRITSTEVAKSAYYGNIYPFLTYGVIFWGNSANVQSTFILQKKCLRIIYNLNSMESARTLFISNNILTLTCIYILEISLFVKEQNEYFPRKSEKKKNLRPQYKYDICTVRPSSYILKKSTYVSGIKVYNHLPERIKALDGPQFKNKLKDFLVHKCFYNLNEYFSVNY